MERTRQEGPFHGSRGILGGAGRLAAIATVSLMSTVAATAPDPPSNPSPPDEAVGVQANPSLCVNVFDPAGADLEVTFHGRDLSRPLEGDFELVVIPDSQNYVQMYPTIYNNQMDWIVDNRISRNIVFVSHVGDIVVLGSMLGEWLNASVAMARLEDPATTELAEGLPYGLGVGNHDQVPSNRPGTMENPGETTVEYNEVFGVWRFEDMSWYGGHWGDNNDNSYQLFEAGGMKFIVIHLEFNDTEHSPELLDVVLDWTEQLLDTYSDHRAIITSHTILCHRVACPPTLWAPFSAQGAAIYDRLKHHENVFLMLCGHAAVSAMQPRRQDTFNGHTIYSILQNYQRGEDCPYHCGNGYLRLYTFKPSEDRIVATTYSPWLEQYKTGPCTDGSSCHEFELAYDMDGGIPFEPVGSLTGVPSGTRPCVAWPGRTVGGPYEWYVTVSDGSETTASDRWTFTSDGSCVFNMDCDEGDGCTDDVCSGSVCVRTPLPNCCETDADCDDGNYCTNDVCNAASCTHTNNSNPCSDRDRCTGGDTCQDGTCVGTTISCEDGNDCTEDTCVDGECISAYAPFPACCTEHWQCNDADRCTADTCGLDGTCVNAPVQDCCTTVDDCPDDGDDCTVESCPLWSEASFGFDGVDDHITMHRAPGLGLAEFTVECWFKWDGGGSPVATSQWQWAPYQDLDGIVAYPLVTKGLADQDVGTPPNEEFQNRLSVNYFLGIDAEGPEPVLAADFEEHEDGSGEWAVNHRVYGSTPVSVDEWHHAAMTYDGSCWQLYLDGHPETDGTNCPAEPPAYESWCYFAIGAAQDKNGGVVAHTTGGDMEGRFSGLIDEVRVWDHALDATEIVANMHEAIGAAPGLIGRWGLDLMTEGSDFLTPDSAGEHPGVIIDGHFVTEDYVDFGGGFCEAPVLLPSEVADLVVDGTVETVLNWEEQGAGTTYDVVGGALSELRVNGGVDHAECLADDEGGPGFSDGRPPPGAGEGYYYLVRAVTECGAGTYGFASDGTERRPLLGCP